MDGSSDEPAATVANGHLAEWAACVACERVADYDRRDGQSASPASSQILLSVTPSAGRSRRAAQSVADEVVS
jgi:hypothetical protein